MHPSFGNQHILNFEVMAVRDITRRSFLSKNIHFYYINTSEIPSELSRENFILSNEFGFRPCTSSMFSNDTFYFKTIENIKVKWFGISLMFI